jgi:hypothetical protein
MGAPKGINPQNGGKFFPRMEEMRRMEKQIA